ncbi:MAG: cell division topological specificity factor MinE [Chloroflexi bacterium]|nr:MAG: cell division topological specificity factor MinE [Chloroflexota bacterium]RLC86019.1 MAG: cell division topological specificity factor MinE [Chloroflexota bacterium]HEY66725.1 cell division topological specificity factor MinE [Thermoflexia bacterium]
MKFFERLLGHRYKPSSGKVAKERLRLVLAHDRTDISPALLETLKDEIITVISRHVAIDAQGVQVTFSQSAHESRLVADIPLLTRRRRRKR